MKSLAPLQVIDQCATRATRFGHVGSPVAGMESTPPVFEEELHQMVLEMQRLAEENDALRKSAEIWIRMYEGQLARADRMAEELQLTRLTAQGPELLAARVPVRV
jgi:hypothetical protein